MDNILLGDALLETNLSAALSEVPLADRSSAGLGTGLELAVLIGGQ